MIIGKKRRYIKTLEQKLAASEAERSRVVNENTELRESHSAAIAQRDADYEKQAGVLAESIDQINAMEKALEEVKDDLRIAGDKNGELNRQLVEANKANGELTRKNDGLSKEVIKLAEFNESLRNQPEPKKPSCDGCVHADNYRKCASCARYPKLKDKYEAEGEPDAG